MTRGRRGEKTYTGYNGAATDRLRALDALAKTPAGTFGRIAAPSPEAVRTFIAAQTCPWCASGPWKVLALHTHLAHGISASEIRQAAGLTKDAQICSDTHHASVSERMAGRRLPDSAYEPGKHAMPRNFSDAGLVAQREKLKTVDRKRAGRLAGDALLRANAPTHTEIARLWTTTDLTQAEIGQRVGFHPRSVIAALKRAGIVPQDADGRALRWHRGVPNE